jgi:hypothetical protein
MDGGFGIGDGFGRKLKTSFSGRDHDEKREEKRDVRVAASVCVTVLDEN